MHSGDGSRGTNLQPFFEVVVLARLRREVSAVGIGIGAAKRLFRDRELGFFWQGEKGGCEGEDLCIGEAEGRVDQVGESRGGKSGGEGAG